MAFVLIVDDETAIRETMQRGLEKAGHRVLTAKSEEEALEKLRGTAAMIHKQERLDALVQLARGIVHDFNNALMPILGLTDHLLQEMKKHNGSPAQIELLDVVMASATDAMSIVQRLQAFYRADADVPQAPIAPDPLVDSVQVPDLP
jgi:CheY-like chemotaxis protein